MMHAKSRILASTCLVAALIATPALAADEPDNSNEIIVTAQKREQNLTDVPISIAAMNASTLDKMQITGLRDFVGQVPNLRVNNFNGRSDTVRLFIRGIGQNDVTLTQDPSVALYVDGVYVGTSIGGGFETEDLERIEVLRGPQGSLYGRNATGGAVNVITAKPTTDRFAAKAAFTLGNYNLRRGTMTLNVPVSDRLAVRLSGARTKRGGVFENTGLGEDFSKQDHVALRAAARFKPVDGVTLDYAFDYSRNKDTGTLTQAIAGAPASFPVAAPTPVPGTFGLATMLTSMVNQFTQTAPFTATRLKRAAAYRPLVPGDGKVTGHTLTLSYEPSDALTLRSISGWRRINNRQYADNLPTHQATIVTSVIASSLPTLPVGTVLSSIGPNGAAATTDYTRFNSFSQELQAVGSAGMFDYVVGLFHYRDHGSQNTLGGAIGSGPLVLQSLTTIRNKSEAVYGELTFRPQEDGPFSATLGARYSWDTREATRINERSFSFAALGGFTAQNCSFFALTFQALGQTCSPTGTVTPATYAHKFHNFSPSLTLAYKLSPDMNLFAKYVRGYKSGGTSQRSANPVNFAGGYAPEKVQSWEAGIKGSPGRIRYGLTGFYMKLANYQASVQTGATAGDRDFLAINGSKIYGIEFDLSASLTDTLTASLNGALLHTKFGQKSASVLLDTGATQVQNFIAPFSYAPKATMSAALDWRQPMNDAWAVGAHLDASYQSKAHTSSNVLDDRTNPAYALVNGSLSLFHGMGDDHELELRLWGRNLFDKSYRTISYGSFAFSGATTVAEFGEPRTYGATLSIKY